MAKRREFSKLEIEDICNQYQSGLPRSFIKNKYKCTDKVILRVLQENNIPIRKLTDKQVKSNRKFNINDNYFNLNNQSNNSAYILGLLAADGCVASAQNQIYIELQRIDKKLLEEINLELKNERPVKDYLNNSKNYENSKLYFFSQQIKKDLSLYNIIPNKTKYNNDFLQNIEKDYEIDFIRGFFDGDGCIKWSNGSICWQIDSTSLTTLEHIKKILFNFNIQTSIITKDDKSSVNLLVYRIQCYGWDNCLKIYQLFYKNKNCLKMDRKHKHFLELLLKYKTHEASNLLNED